MRLELTVIERHYLNIINALKDYDIEEIKHFLFNKTEDEEFVLEQRKVIDKIAWLRHTNSIFFE